MKLVGPAFAGALAAGLLIAGQAGAQPYGPGPHGSHGQGAPHGPGPARPRGPGSPPPNSLGADWRQQQDEAREAVKQRRLEPLGRVLEQIRRRTPGRQLDAGLEQEGARQVYRVRWMTSDGRRIDYIVDAVTGAILRGG
jgi:hypothetical protein